jgi:hypothetical protein
MAAAGGYFSTASDLLKAAHGIFDTGFLAPASQKALRTIEVASDSYALGGRVRTLWVDGKPIRPAGRQATPPAIARSWGIASTPGPPWCSQQHQLVAEGPGPVRRQAVRRGDAGLGRFPVRENALSYR